LRVHHSLDNGNTNVVQSSQKLNQITSPILTSLRERALGDLTTVTRVLLGAVAMVLLIACVNVAGLMLVRAEGRSREIAIRTAVGASRGRIVRQLFTESLLLAGSGGIGGVLLGQVFLKGLVSFIPDDVPRWVRFDLDWRFALFAVAVTGAAALVFGLAPAFQAASLGASRCRHEMGRSTLSQYKRRSLGVLAAVEVTLAVILLSSSGLLLEAFKKVLHTDPGFRTENVITWDLRPETAYPKPLQAYTFYKTLLDRLGALPGVRSASAASLPALSGHSGYFFVSENGRQFGAKDGAGAADHRATGPRPAHVRRTYYGRAAEAFALGAARLLVAIRSLRGGSDSAGRRRDLRRNLIRSESPHSRNRYPHGSGRATRAGDASRARERHDSGRRRRGRWIDRFAVHGEPAAIAVVWRECARCGRLHGGGCGRGGDRFPGQLHSGTACIQSGSHERAALRMIIET
jgi:hypothetical protein